MFTTKTQDNVNNNCNPTTAFTSFHTSTVHQAQQSFSDMLTNSSALDDDQNGNGRDRTHLSLNFKDLKPREPSSSGISPISLPISLLDSSLLLSPEKILLVAQQHQNNQQQQSHQQLFQQPKLETPTPSNFIFPKNVSASQQEFADGFQSEALQKLQGDTSLPTFQNNSPSTVKFLLSLAALTPTLSPSAPNKPLFGQQTHNPPATSAGDLNLGSERKLEIPKVLVNNLIPNLSSSANITDQQTANDIAKRYMEYFQLGQGSSTNNNPTEFIQQQIPQFSAPPPVSIGMGQAKAPQANFIKNEQPEQLLLSDSSLAGMQSNSMAMASNGHQMPCPSTIATHRNGNPKPLSNTSGEEPDQNVKKLERKRARNRLAASKCRQRKLQKISDLEQQVANERERGSELQEEIIRLQNLVSTLQEKLTHTEMNRQGY